MKHLNKFLAFLPIAVITVLMFTIGCTKEGPQGPAGTNGEDGQDGQDGNATCGQCHDFSETIKGKMVQYDASLHATGTAFERNSTSCAPCHTSKGFREVMETGAQATGDAISNPTPVNCYTCHNIHQTYSADDWALASIEPVTHWQGGTVFDGGTGNLCANCHQTRPSTLPDAGNPSGDFIVSSTRFGTHHGPQSNLLLGVDGYGTTSDGKHAHFAEDFNSCIGCHLAEAYGNQAGGHNMGVTYEYHGGDEILTAGCLNCHSDEDALLENTEEFYADMEEEMTMLWDMLVEAGIGNAEDPTYAIPGTYSNAVAGAFYNFKYLEEDKSKGLHNPTYSQQLINAAKDALSK